MSDGPEQFPKRTKGRVEVRHRTGAEAEARRQVGPPQVEKIKAPHRRLDDDEELKGRRRVVRRLDDGSETSRLYVLVAGSLCILMVAAVIWMLVIRPAAARKALEGGGESPMVLRDVDPVVEVSSFVTNATAEEIAGAVEAVVRGFMSSTTNEERCRWVNGGPAALERMAEYYSREGEEAPKGFEEIVGSSPLPFGGVPMQVVQAAAPDDETLYLFNVFPGKERMLIDWESSVGYGEMTWDAFVEEAPTESVEMRIYLQPDDYYNYEFSDDQKYQCFSLGYKGKEETVYGFVERDSETAREILEVVPNRGALPVRVRVHYLPWSTDKKMVWIEEFIHPFWVDPVTIEEALEE